MSKTVSKILDTAQELVQTRGYNAFSYRDLAERVGIKTSSIHYYFPTKGDLGRELMKRYRGQFRQHLEDVDREAGSASQRLERYVGLYERTFRDGEKTCLCASLSADATTLPDEVCTEIRGFFRDNEDWLARLIETGVRSEEFRSREDPRQAARSIVNALEGAMLAARAFSSVDPIVVTGGWLVSSLKP